MNVILIGLPASGKSTVGVILAKVTGRSFIDTDLVIQSREGTLLSEIIAARGTVGFLSCEEQALLSVSSDNAVIATGGSAVYSARGMEHLKSSGTVVYLRASERAILDRLNDIEGRGVVLRDGQTTEDMISERLPLYERYADIIIDEDGMTVEQTVRQAAARIKEHERQTI